MTRLKSAPADKFPISKCGAEQLRAELPRQHNIVIRHVCNTSWGKLGSFFQILLTAVDPAFSGEAQSDCRGLVERWLRQIGFVFSNRLLRIILLPAAVLRLLTSGRRRFPPKRVHL
jgi:hypothetical protein